MSPGKAMMGKTMSPGKAMMMKGTKSPGSATKPSKVKIVVTATPGEEVPPVEGSKASLTYKMYIEGTTLCFYVADDYELDGNTPFAHHIHMAPAGENGPIAVNLGAFAMEGCIANIDMMTIEHILAEPCLFYLNVHSDLTPSGFVRAQLSDYCH
eukprot:CAMPEP_0172439782 /NCGR_PEP_ID=MMETSP1065-20121228/655_1 /TAXON_ID=265537 /ORGANISM="Amphiprora paludosa, Strain CCMP125" /LENGTH=153 /DNA_ID=CAMNT_0013188513 /DNA_START=22 /DNA_END=483 /DNA_ORIENTATION=-